MSHKANAWLALLPPDAVKAGAFRILFHLCDHHNDERDPEIACFPSQETLMRKTGLSNGGLNNAIASMEKDGLLLRRRSTVPGTSTRRTYYILGCDGPILTKLTPESGVSPNSSRMEPATEQTPFLKEANSSFEGGKLQPTGEEPISNLKSKQYCAADAPHDQFDFGSFFESLWRVYPKQGSWSETEMAVLELVDAGVKLEKLEAAVKAYAKYCAGFDAQRIKLSQNFFADDFWKKHVPAKAQQVDNAEILKRRAETILTGPRWASRSIKPSEAGECILVGLVDEEQCRTAGINV